MLVTDKQYYMEPQLITKCDLYFKRQKKKFDHLILMDGEEGYGKTTKGVSLGYYLAYKTNVKFDVDNIFFDAEKMMEFASKTERQVIMWDEAAFGAMGANWQNKTQQKLIQCLMTCRKKGHFWIFLIPEVNTMKDYFIRRACALIHVYSRDDITRGRYVYFNKKKKNNLRIKILKRQIISYKAYSFRGTFTNALPKIINEDEYEAQKDIAIAEAFSGKDKVNPYKERYEDLKCRLGLLYYQTRKVYPSFTQQYVGEIINKNPKYISRCFKDAQVRFGLGQEDKTVIKGASPLG